MTSALIYSPLYRTFDYGPTHPLRTVRLAVTHALMDSCGLLSIPCARYVDARVATDEELLLFHRPEYVALLKDINEGRPVLRADRFGLGSGDNPAFRGLLDWSRLVTGASLQAAELVESGEVQVAFNMAGGLHHALPALASGFCYINDPAIAIISLLRKGRRVAYVDIDAHHGDGVQEAFFGTDQVLTVSVHESGHSLFPGTGFVEEMGVGAGLGYAVNIPLPPFSDDELFLYAFESIVPPIIERFKPDIIVSQLGVDALRGDPLTHLNYTNNGFCKAVETMRTVSPKWVALGGGGYEISNVARAWTLAWASMNGLAIADVIPQEFLLHFRNFGFLGGRLRDDNYMEMVGKEQMWDQVRSTVAMVRERIFPLIR